MSAELPQMVKLARDHAILGLYPESLSIFQQALRIIDSQTEGKWARMRNAISEEFNIVIALNDRMNKFLPCGGQDSRRVVPASRQPQTGCFQISIENPNFKGKVEGGIGRHITEPFSHHDKQQDEVFPNFKAQPRTNTYKKAPEDSENRKVVRSIPQKKWTNPKKEVNAKTSPKFANPFKSESKIEPASKNKQLASAARKEGNKLSEIKSPFSEHKYEPKRDTRPEEKKTTNLVERKIDQRQTPSNPRPPKKQDQPTFAEQANINHTDLELVESLEREIVTKNPNVSFDDITDLDDAKMVLQESVLLPILMPEYFTGIRKPCKGVLLFGPPGTGKTMLAKSIAALGKTTFFNVSASTLGNKYRGQSEKLVRYLFEMARFYAPTCIFFDEIDALGGKRGSGDKDASRRILSELLVQMDGVHSGDAYVMALAATNRPWDLDEALRRRLEKRIYVPLPAASGRKKLFEFYLSSVNFEAQIDWKAIVKMSKGYSGADIANVCRDASMMPMRRKLSSIQGINQQAIDSIRAEATAPVTYEDLVAALKNVSRSVSNADLEQYSKWMKDFGSV